MTTGTPRRYDVAALRRDHPVERVVAGYGVALRRVGRALVGRCPFHADGAHPNLHVYPDTASWYCYACHVGGDVIEFVRRREGLDFPAACARLTAAPRIGPPPGRASARRERRWDRLTLAEQVVMNTVCTLYQRVLWREPRAPAYLRARGLPDWVIRQCAVGYADGHSLEAYLRRRSGLCIAQQLGLLHKPARADGAPREFLAGRVVVPELRGGQCLWLIGRALEDDPSRPKYLGLPGERPVLGYERVAGRREAFLAEGVFDYLTAIAWRLPACSPCGTALPAERLGFLARARVVYGVLDGDAAGRAAAAGFAAQLGERFRPLRLPDGCDLNDLGRRPGGGTPSSACSAPRGGKGYARHARRGPMGSDGSPTARDERARRAALRDDVLACGRRIGWSAHTTIAFTEGLARRPWKRCSPAELAAALGELRVTMRAAEARRRAPAGADDGRTDGRNGHAPRE